MPARTYVQPVSSRRRWIGIALSGVAVLFLLFDSAIKLMQIEPVRVSMVKLGYPVELAVTLGLIELICVLLYVAPRTAGLGLVLLTGYLGGATASHVRLLDPLLSHVLFPSYIAALLWGGMYLRDTRLQVLNPLAR